MRVRSVLPGFWVGLAFVSSSSSAFAGVAVDGRPEKSETADVTQRLMVGGSYRNFDYVETSPTNPHLDDEKGNMPGVNLEYRRDYGNYFLSAELTFIDSHTTYHGSDQSFTTPVVSSTKTNLIEFEVNAGIPMIQAENGFKIWGYTGLGYHYWRRGQAGTVNGVSTYRENYAWLVLPLGVRFEQALGDTVKISLDLAARLSTSGTLDIKLSEIDPVLADAHVDLGSKVGYKIRLPIEFRLSPTTFLVANPWYEYLSIGESNVTELELADGTPTGEFIEEPDSRTKQAGATVQVGFIF